MENSVLLKLLFIYNADSGLRNTLIDSAHKIFSPRTYQCNLCDITYGRFTEKSRWKKFRKQTDLEMEFLYKDEFQKQYASKFGHKFTYPIVLAATANGLEVFITTEEMNKLTSVDELTKLVQERKVIFTQ